MLYLQLLLSFMKIGFFSFGGGNAMLPLIAQEVVTVHHWLSLGELSQLIAVSQMTPGPIAISAATYVGYKLLGFTGATVATLAVMSPAFVIVLLLTRYYRQIMAYPIFRRILEGIKPVVVLLIFWAGLKLGQGMTWYYTSYLIAGTSLLLLMKTKIHPLTLILIGGGLGLFLY